VILVTDAPARSCYGVVMKVTYDPPPARPGFFVRVAEDFVEAVLALLVTLLARPR
jgi:hypothetical protein